MKKCLSIVLCVFVSALLSSCGKGYDARVRNYYIEPMDTVFIGGKYVITDVARQATSEYKHISEGTYDITFITTSKNRIFAGTLKIPKRGTEKITLQIDGQGTVLMIKDEK